MKSPAAKLHRCRTKSALPDPGAESAFQIERLRLSNSSRDIMLRLVSKSIIRLIGTSSSCEVNYLLRNSILKELKIVLAQVRDSLVVTENGSDQHDKVA